VKLSFIFEKFFSHFRALVFLYILENFEFKIHVLPINIYNLQKFSNFFIQYKAKKERRRHQHTLLRTESILFAFLNIKTRICILHIFLKIELKYVPILKHLSNRHFLQRFRFATVTSQSPLLRHLSLS